MNTDEISLPVSATRLVDALTRLAERDAIVKSSCAEKMSCPFTFRGIVCVQSNSITPGKHINNNYLVCCKKQEEFATYYS